MKTKTYAKLLEKQGYFIEAVDVYKKLLENSSYDKEVEEAIKKYKGVNLKVLEFFTRMEREKDYQKLERWLYKWS